MNGGYDDGYRDCPCFWGTEPGSFVRLLQRYVPDFSGLSVLDAGCGEGKNAAFLARQGARVDAIDVSELAIRNARLQWPDLTGLIWEVGDIRCIELPREHYDVVVAYGLFHCMQCAAEVGATLLRLREAIRPSGYLVMCAFNERRQELSAHPGFTPCLLSHVKYVGLFSEWQIIAASDADLTERHPHNAIEHTHSLTRILARKEQG
jgi:tellurite methyltransferase